MLFSLFISSIKAQTYLDLTTVGGSITMGYSDVAATPAPTWITTVSLPAIDTKDGKCGTAAATFALKSTTSITFYLAKCDQLDITANIASGRSLNVSINGGANISCAGTGVCKDYIIPVNSEVQCNIKVIGASSSAAYTSFFNFTYTPKSPSISAFQINGNSATIDQTGKTISLQLPYGTDLTAVTPTVTLGGTATSYTPTDVQNFTTGPITYTATDGTTPVPYLATITAKSTPDTLKSITSLTINGKTATSFGNAFTFNFPSFMGPLASWPVTFTLNGATASANFTSGSSYDFSLNNTLSITVTAQDGSSRIYTVTPTVSTKKNIGMLTLNGQAETYDNVLASAFSNYYVTYLLAAATAPTDINAFYKNFDLIVLHANVSGTNATGLATSAMVGVKPMLNLKAFFYNSGRWAWSTAAPISSAAGLGSADVATSLQSHPIFKNVSFTGAGTTLSYYDNLPAANVNGTQWASDLATLPSTFTSNTIATNDGVAGIQAHEIQNNIAAKYLLIGLSMEGNNYSYFNANTINILQNAAAYLLDPNTHYNFTTNSITTSLTNLSDKNQIYYNNGTIYNPNQQSVIVFNANGMKVKCSMDRTIDTQSLAKGVYLVQSDNMKVFKFIK